jgi:DNA invertase Pin-like site-specific DNA recombinase
MKAALYIRVSTNHQIDKDSLPFQRKELINYSKYVLNINDYEVFQDAGYSGKNTDRPEYQQMISRCRAGEFSHIVVWKIDRISRNLLDFAEMYEELKELEVTFVSKNEQFDTSSAMGEAMLKIILIFAELERKMTAERVKAIMLARAEKGQWNGAGVPLGYQWSASEGFPVVDPDESQTISMIYNAYASEKSTTAIVRMLSEMHIPTKRGGIWGTKGVVDIIRNPFYKGTYRYNYRKSGRGKKKDPSEWIIVDDNHEAIIDKKLWALCNAIMDKNAKKNSSQFRQKKHTHIFSGLIRCAECGEVFHSSKDSRRSSGFIPSRYRCKSDAYGHGCDAKIITDVTLGPFVFNYILNILKAHNQNEPLDSVLLDGDEFINCKISSGFKALCDVVINPSTKSIQYALSNDTSKNWVRTESLKSIDVKITKFKRAIDRLDDLYLFSDEGMSEKDYILKKQKFANEIDALSENKKLIELEPLKHEESSLIAQASEFILINELDQNHIDFVDLWMGIDSEYLKAFIQSIIEEIEVKDGKVSAIKFNNGIENRFEWS